MLYASVLRCCVPVRLKICISNNPDNRTAGTCEAAVCTCQVSCWMWNLLHPCKALGPDRLPVLPATSWYTTVHLCECMDLHVRKCSNTVILYSRITVSAAYRFTFSSGTSTSLHCLITLPSTSRTSGARIWCTAAAFDTYKQAPVINRASMMVTVEVYLGSITHAPQLCHWKRRGVNIIWFALSSSAQHMSTTAMWTPFRHRHTSGGQRHQQRARGQDTACDDRAG
jgi:hypothetical protein